MRKLSILLSILMFAAILGCQSNPKFTNYNDQVDEEMGAVQKIPVYVWDRFLDLTDIIRLNLGFGDGFLLNAHATKWLQLGGGYRDGMCFGIMPRSFGMWHEDRSEGGIVLAPILNYYFKNYTREALWGTTTLFDHDVSYKGMDYMNNKTRHWSDIGLDLHFFLFGIDASISPYEIFDFVFGIFGAPWIAPVDPVGVGTEIDVANDDLRARKVRNDSDMPYYNYTLDPRPKEKCPGCDDEPCGCEKK